MFQLVNLFVIILVRLNEQRTVKTDVLKLFYQRFKVEYAFPRQTHFAPFVNVGKVHRGNIPAHLFQIRQVALPCNARLLDIQHPF